MRSNEISLKAEEPKDTMTNVPVNCEHIDSDTICHQEYGTLANNPNLTFLTNGQQCFIYDGTSRYAHKGIPFEIKDGYFETKGLKFELPRKTHLTPLDRVALSLGMSLVKEDTPKTINIKTYSFRKLFEVFTMLALRDLKLIPNSFSSRKQRRYGEHVFSVYYKAVVGSGHIKASNKHIRWLNERDVKQLKAKLFKTTGYRPGVNAMRYEPTELMEIIISQVFQFLHLLEFEKSKISLQSLDFSIPRELLNDIRLRDVMILLSDCINYDNGFIIRPNLMDRQYSRVYSCFTSISSDSRKLLGFTNYDIGSALQTICLQLVEDPSLYPLHQELMNDKKGFRAKVQGETGKDYKWVKKELSKINNEKDTMPKRYEKSQTLKAYYKEAMVLRKKILASVEPLIYSRAYEFAKPKWEKTSWNPVINDFTWITYEKKESSIFFFIWTQWERQIRESMMSCFDDPSACHQVHDAVYSRQIINPKIIETRVLQDTGFKVQISTD